METEVRGNGESSGAEGNKEIGLSSCGCGSPFGQDFNVGPGEERPLDGAASRESGGRAEKETGSESEEKT
jgi:hypothetical protein